MFFYHITYTSDLMWLYMFSNTPVHSTKVNEAALIRI